ncbi:hypothetical protein RB653_002869 [Dictyostelium firmibasis]|uniref:Uncharacterized protein n=1 Tax=Dictyostelium firmibasis TaxID=79012 RepID=A0AAN7YQF8_9MYCE
MNSSLQSISNELNYSFNSSNNEITNKNSTTSYFTRPNFVNY